MILFPSILTAEVFSSREQAEDFVNTGNWELIVSGKSAGEVEFSTNHTLPEGKAVKLGNKEHRFWSVNAHPTVEGKFVLRVHSKKSAGWHSFTWNSKKNAWVSKNWPKHQISKK